MPSTYTDTLSLQQFEEFGSVNIWGPPTNINMAKIDARFGRVRSLDVGTLTTTTISGSQAVVGGTDAFMYRFTGTLQISKAVEFPSTSRGLYIIKAETNFAGHTLTIRGGGGTDEIQLTSQGTRIIIITDSGVEIFEIETPQTAIIGEIRMFTDEASLPTGWYVCNGSNGTPNLLDKFVRAANTSGNEGGNDSATTSSSTLTVTGSTEGHALTEAELPAHRHFSILDTIATVFGGLLGTNSPAKEVSVTGNNDQYNLGTGSGEATLGRTSATGQGQAHSHDLSLSTASHSHTVATLPAYYSLIFAQYRGA